MSSAPVNPYQSPQQTDQPQLEELLKESPLRFRFDLTREDVSKALAATGIRPELRMRKIALAVAGIPLGLFLLVHLLGTLSPNSNAGIPSGIFFVTAIFGASILSSFLMRRRLVSIHTHMMGESAGQLDSEGLLIEQEHQTRFRNLDAIVTSATSKDWWLMTFDETRSQLEMLPRRGFEDQAGLDLVIRLVDQVTPDTKLRTMDLRRMEMPAKQSRFLPASDAIRFSGKLYLDDLKATRFLKAGKRATRLMWIPVLLMLGIGMLWMYTEGEELLSGWFLVFAIGLPGFIAGKAFLRVYLAKRASRDKETGESVLWSSRGWFDEKGVVSMTVSGESKTDWPHFHSFDITERIIALQSPSGEVWHLFGRNQFDDEGWEKAVDLVRRNVTA